MENGTASVCQTVIEEAGDEVLVEMLADEDNLLHAVAILLVPIATEAWILLHELLQFVFWHGGIPLASIADADLTACLLKDVTGFLFILEITDALGTDDALWPLARHELVEEP